METARQAAFPQPGGRFRRWWQVLCLGPGHRGQVSQDMRDRYRRGFRSPKGPACTLPGCRRPGWSLPLSLSRSARSARSHGPTGPAAERAGRAGAGRRAADHRLAPGAPQPAQRAGRDRHRYLARHGLVTPDPAKRPKSSCIRFAAEMPNPCWQADFPATRSPAEPAPRS
jgi:hypothetical protein